MAALSIGIAFLVRAALLFLFFPCSALDKIVNFAQALRQAEAIVRARIAAAMAIAAGLFIEIVMSFCVLTGFADRAAALVLAFYCGATALLWKRFWAPGDFWTSNTGKGRTLFWDFLKNFAVAGGFLLITFGTSARTVQHFVDAPFSSTQPYSLSPE